MTNALNVSRGLLGEASKGQALACVRKGIASSCQSGQKHVTGGEDGSAQKQFEEYYKLNSLQTVDSKISHLKSAMKIRAILCDGDETPDETLAGLEEIALHGSWKASW